MNRCLTTFLVLLALTGVVSGNLFRPCDCTPDEMTGARALCHARALEMEAPLSCCGGCHRSALGKAPGDMPGGEDPDEEGCSLCCKPRPPVIEAKGAITLADVQAVVVAVLNEMPSAVAAPARATTQTLTHERRTSDQWLLSREGLAVFLI